VCAGSRAHVLLQAMLLPLADICEIVSDGIWFLAKTDEAAQAIVTIETMRLKASDDDGNVLAHAGVPCKGEDFRPALNMLRACEDQPHAEKPPARHEIFGGNRLFTNTPMLLCGPPGTGKTFFAKSLGGLPFRALISPTIELMRDEIANYPMGLATHAMIAKERKPTDALQARYNYGAFAGKDIERRLPSMVVVDESTMVCQTTREAMEKFFGARSLMLYMGDFHLKQHFSYQLPPIEPAVQVF
jgi:hypothetical protein